VKEDEKGAEPSMIDRRVDDNRENNGDDRCGGDTNKTSNNENTRNGVGGGDRECEGESYGAGKCKGASANARISIAASLAPNEVMGECDAHPARNGENGQSVSSQRHAAAPTSVIITRILLLPRLQKFGNGVSSFVGTTFCHHFLYAFA
jgi:hypothetical protein